MTLTRTIRRREMRKRAKKRATSRVGNPFLTVGWLWREAIAVLSTRVTIAERMSR